MSSSVCVTLLALWLVVASASPVRRSPDLEARRRSAIDRSMVRFGRSYPAEPSAADILEAYQRPVRSRNNFLRFGRSEHAILPNDDLIAFLKAYEEDQDSSVSKNSPIFLRPTRRDQGFIRFGRSISDDDQNSELALIRVPQRKHRARDHFIRLGRDNEETSDNELDDVEESREKRSTEA